MSKINPYKATEVTLCAIAVGGALTFLGIAAPMYLLALVLGLLALAVLVVVVAVGSNLAYYVVAVFQRGLERWRTAKAEWEPKE